MTNRIANLCGRKESENQTSAGRTLDIPAEDAGQESPVDRVSQAVDLLFQAGGEPFCDLLGNLWIRRTGGMGARQSCEEYPLKSELTVGWISRLVYEAGIPALRTWELTQLNSILVGFAIDNRERLEVADILEQDLVLVSLNILIGPKDPFRATATNLLRALQLVGERMSFGSKQDERWPKDGAHLTRHLRRMQPWLAELGISYEYQRQGQQRLHVLGRTEAQANPELVPTTESKSLAKSVTPPDAVTPNTVAAVIPVSGATAVTAKSSAAHDDTDAKNVRVSTAANRPQLKQAPAHQAARPMVQPPQPRSAATAARVSQSRSAHSAAVNTVGVNDDTALKQTSSGVSSCVASHANPVTARHSAAYDDADDRNREVVARL